ncbi:MAG: twin-arginine translocase TatA/TatE family subunit [Actinobacteria bacterium]|nr:twin-arginine translocase TatA/TatE family subunit [Actinomycetota bacterium]
MLGNIGPLEIIVVLIIALIVFGPKRLPELGNSLGKGIREFKDSVTGENKDDEAEEDAAGSVATPKAVEEPVEPPTTHRVEADDAEVVHDKNG